MVRTRLFLGLADAPGYHGDPGGYGDNTGQFSAEFAIVPEPSVIGLIGVGAGLAAFRLRRSSWSSRRIGGSFSFD